VARLSKKYKTMSLRCPVLKFWQFSMGKARPSRFSPPSPIRTSLVFPHCEILYFLEAFLAVLFRFDMAYPFPRFMKPSHVPPGIAGVESPYTTKLRKKNSTPSSTHVVLIIFATVAFLYYVCSPPRDDKRPYGNIPYSHDEISE
jgi:hypothetical protein